MDTKACAVTGHRPTRFKFKYNENNTGCKRLKKRLHDQFVELYRQGFRRFYVGGALGVDMWAGEILLRLKEQPEYGDIQLVEVLPFAGHDAKWDERSQKRMVFLLRHSTEVIQNGDPSLSDAQNYRRRNQFMVDHADCLLAVYNETQASQSGTGMTVRYAQKKNLPIILIHPDSGTVRVLDQP